MFNSKKINTLKFFKTHILFRIYNLKWSFIRSLGSSQLSKSTIFIPIIGYIILFGNEYQDYFKVIFENYNYQKMIFLYYGFTLIAIGTILFSLTCPSIIKIYQSEEEYINGKLQIISGSPKSLEDLIIEILHYNKHSFVIDQKIYDLIYDNFISIYYYLLKNPSKKITDYDDFTELDISLSSKNPNTTPEKMISDIKKYYCNIDIKSRQNIIESLKLEADSKHSTITYRQLVEQLLSSHYFFENHSKSFFKLSCYFLFFSGIILVLIPSLITLFNITCFTFFESCK